MEFLKNSLGGALDWAHNFAQDSGARRKHTAMRYYLLHRLQQECADLGIYVEVIKQPAVRPAMKVAVELGVKEHSASLEYGGDNWSDIVFGILKQLEQCDEATVFLQLAVREARAYVCCTQARGSTGSKYKRKVTIIDVIDSASLITAYQDACAVSK